MDLSVQGVEKRTQAGLNLLSLELDQVHVRLCVDPCESKKVIIKKGGERFR